MWSAGLAALLAAAAPGATEALTFTSALASAESGLAGARRRFLRTPSNQSLVAPLSFDRKLLLCNAYPSASPISVEKNGRETIAGGDKDALSYQECRYAQSAVQSQDRLEFQLRDLEVHGTFEVGELPESDAVLLLVLEKRADGPMLSFASYAFPPARGRREAQIAVINAYQGNMSNPHLKMEDHVSIQDHTAAKVATVKRVEQLNFNRIYSIEEGTYDACIADPPRMNGTDAETDLETSTRKTVQLVGGVNYVVFRAGGGSDGESLVVFADGPGQANPSASMLDTLLKPFRLVEHWVFKK